MKRVLSSLVTLGVCALMCISPMHVTGETYVGTVPSEVGSGEILNPSLTDSEKEELLNIGTQYLYHLMFERGECRNSLENARERASIGEDGEYFSGWKNRWGVQTLTDYEKQLLAEITWLEAGNQGLVGQEYVVTVILNRLTDPDFDNDLKDVLSADGQFTTWKKRATAQPTDETYEAIEAVLSGEADEKVTDVKFLYFNTSQGSFKYKGHYFS